MLTLSIKPIWAYAIFSCEKDVENRNWFTDYRGTLLIHSSHNYLSKDIERFNKHFNSSINMSDVILGAIIGTVEVVDCVLTSDSPWFTGRYGFLLKNPKRLSEPIYTKGHHGLWQYR